MGEVSSVIKAFSCEACAKYVCNSCHFPNECMRNGCEIDFTTPEVKIPSDDSDVEIEVEGCCVARKHA